MEKKAIDKNDLFLAWRRGSQEALLELMTDERAYLYDYLLRMTGDRSRSEDAVFEVTELMPKQTLEYASYAECRQYLFKTARASCRDIWNSDTVLLSEDLRAIGSDSRHQAQIQAFAGALRALTGPLRECVLLLHRFDFDVAGAAVVMGESEEKVKSGEVQTIKALLAGVVESPQDAIKLLRRLPFFELPMGSGQTQDIHDLVSQMRERTRDKLYRLLVAFLLVIIVLGILWLGFGYFPK